MAINIPALLTSVSMRPKRAIALGGLGTGNIAVDGDDIGIVKLSGFADRARIGDHSVADVPKALHQLAPMPREAPVMIATFRSEAMVVPVPADQSI